MCESGLTGCPVRSNSRLIDQLPPPLSPCTIPQLITYCQWADIVRGLFDETGYPVPTAIFFVSYMVRARRIFLTWGRFTDQKPPSPNPSISRLRLVGRMVHLIYT